MARELNAKMRPSHFTELTDQTFFKFVNNPTKSSIIEVYAPRCISCQNQYNDLERILVAFEVWLVVCVDSSRSRCSSGRSTATRTPVSARSGTSRRCRTSCTTRTGGPTRTRSRRCRATARCWTTSTDSSAADARSTDASPTASDWSATSRASWTAS